MQVKVYGRTEEAAWAAIRICSDRGVLKEYLAGREKEVVSIVTQLFDQEYASEQFHNAREAEGREETLVPSIKYMMKNLWAFIPECA